MSTTRPAAPAYTEFISFIVSMIATTVSGVTSVPTSTNGAAHPAGREKMEEMLRDHRERILHGLKHANYFSLLVVDYPALVRAPEEWLERIREFVGVPANHPYRIAGISQHLGN